MKKEDAPCCVAKRDDHGRLPIGYCSPECVRRPVRTTVQAAARPPKPRSIPAPPAEGPLFVSPRRGPW